MDTRTSFKRMWLLLVSCIFIVGTAAAQDTTDSADTHVSQGEHIVLNETDLEWGPGAPGLPPGAEMVVLEGNPAEEGPFTLRAKLPANYQIAPHRHPGLEHLTVLSGTFHVGMGEEMDQDQGQALAVGGFMAMPPEAPHYAWTTEETIIQLHGVGPWDIIYLNESDDPRNQAQ